MNRQHLQRQKMTFAYAMNSHASAELDIPEVSQYINELYPNRILRVNFSEIQFAFETAEIEMVRLSYC